MWIVPTRVVTPSSCSESGPDGHVLFWLSRSTIGLIYLHNSVFSAAPLSTQTPPSYAVRPLGREGSEIMYFRIKLSVRAVGSHLASGVTDMEATSKCGSMSCQTSRAGGWRHLWYDISLLGGITHIPIESHQIRKCCQKCGRPRLWRWNEVEVERRFLN